MTDTTLQTVLLRDERSSLQAIFVPAAGMLCASLRHHGEELLAQNAGVDAYAAHGHTMGIPLLYPWANRLADFDYSIAGRTVTVPHDPALIALDPNGLPIHGAIGGRMRWQHQQPTTGARGSAANSILARLRWNESAFESDPGLAPELFELFPFTHDLEYRAHLDDGRLRIELTVHASGDDHVPVAFGFHPYLSPAGWLATRPAAGPAGSAGGPAVESTGAHREHWAIELPAMRRLQLGPNQIPTGPGETLPMQRFELAERQFDDGFDSVALPARFSATSAATRSRRIELELEQGYPCAQVYAPRESEFICFEPMTAPANALRSGTGLRVLAPGERCTAAFSVRVSRANETAAPR